MTLELKNELGGSSSPYLRAHHANPVAWQEWSPKSLALAKQHERLIFLSIGYSACHWCHVMGHESFQSAEVATLLNRSFIPIKVDRESRPDLDEIYMNYVTATTGSGGWPLNVFLTPDLQPVFGGTYWPSPGSQVALPTPADPSEDRPLNFVEILQKMQDIWQNERQKCLISAADITHQLQAFAAEGIHAHSLTQFRGTDDDNDPPEPLDLDLLDDALDHFVARYDSKYGGFLSGAGTSGPKFPTPANLTFLLRVGASITRPSTHTRFGFPNPIPAILGRKSCATAATMALHTLQAISRSALRDHLGNGFHRYSVTPDWNMPHFEKMLYDNAQLLAVYCDAWALGRDPEVLGTIYDLVEYLTSPDSPIVRKQGGWYSSEDADSSFTLKATNIGHNEKKEGAFYVWTMRELQTVLGDRDALVVARHFGVTEHGNIPDGLDVNDEFITQNVLHVDATPSVLAKDFGLKDDEVVRIIKEGKKKLLEFRIANRAPPDVDDKMILSWNALAISALARAANTLASIDETRAKLSIETAKKATAFIKQEMFDSATGKLTRIHSDQHSTSETSEHVAFVDDYAYMIHALRTLYDLTFDHEYLDWALQLQTTLDRDFSAGRNGGYFQAAATTETLKIGVVVKSPTLIKTQDPMSTAVPIQDQSETASSNPTPTQSPNILNLKLGTDNALPSPNGIIASNLLYLSSYISALQSTTADTDNAPASTTKSTSTSLYTTAQNTINAFAPEIIQHPFLYVTLLSSIVLDTVTVKTLIIPSSLPEPDIESKGLRGFGRTISRAPADSPIHTDDVMICDSRTRTCRVLQAGELQKLDDQDGFELDENADGFGFAGAEGGDGEVAARDVIERRDEEARKESERLDRSVESGVEHNEAGGVGDVGTLPPA